MTDQPKNPTISLNGEQWKKLLLLNLEQLHAHLQQIPGNIETGASGLTDEHIANIDKHISEGVLLLRAWRVSKIQVAAPQQAAAQETHQHADKGNGAAPKKGGWPKGKKRAARNQEVTQ